MENWEGNEAENRAEERDDPVLPGGPEQGGALPETPGPEDTPPERPEQPVTGAQARRDASAGRELYLNVRVLVTMMALFVLVFTFAARVIVVSGPSMQNTLFGGDLILVWSAGYTPEAGDVVVLTQESYQEDSIVKRVIATEGQRVDIDYGTSTVYVDDMPIVEDYIKERMNLPSWGEGVNHVVVPEGCIFVMGDNRNHSADSRYPDIGIVDTRCVIGRGVVVLFPFQHWKGL